MNVRHGPSQPNEIPADLTVAYAVIRTNHSNSVNTDLVVHCGFAPTDLSPKSLSPRGSDPLEAKPEFLTSHALAGEGLTPFGIGSKYKYKTQSARAACMSYKTTKYRIFFKKKASSPREFGPRDPFANQALSEYTWERG
jgi:hypothetical protein